MWPFIKKKTVKQITLLEYIKNNNTKNDVLLDLNNDTISDACISIIMDGEPVLTVYRDKSVVINNLKQTI